jgi:hypothetical protein
MGRQTEQLLHPHIDARSAVGGVVDGEAGAGRRGEPGWGLGVEAAVQVPGDQGADRVGQRAVPN